MEDQTPDLSGIVGKIGESVLATTETIEKLANRVDNVAHQVQQQGYQIFALGDAIQTLAENHDATLSQLAQLTESLRLLVSAIEETDNIEEL